MLLLAAGILSMSETRGKRLEPSPAEQAPSVAVAGSSAGATTRPTEEHCAPAPNTEATPDQGASPRATDEGALIEGRDFRVSFGPGRIEYTAKDAAGQPLIESSWAYSLGRVMRGNAVLASNAGAQPHPQGDHVDFVHDGVIERYSTRPNGVEQEFLISRLEGTGDLVVESTVATPLVGVENSTASGSLYFSDSRTGALVLAYGEAIARDSAGQSTRVTRKWEHGRLALTVPGAWVAQAQAPITIDPLIGGNVHITAAPTDEIDPSIAYNSSQNDYLVAFIYSAAQTVAVTRISSVGGPLNYGSIADVFSSSAPKSGTALAYSDSATNRYLLTFSSGAAFIFCVLDGSGNKIAGPTVIDKGIGLTPNAVTYTNNGRWVVSYSLGYDGQRGGVASMAVVDTAGTVSSYATVDTGACTAISVGSVPGSTSTLFAYVVGSTLYVKPTPASTRTAIFSNVVGRPTISFIGGKFFLVAAPTTSGSSNTISLAYVTPAGALAGSVVSIPGAQSDIGLTVGNLNLQLLVSWAANGAIYGQVLTYGLVTHGPALTLSMANGTMSPSQPRGTYNGRNPQALTIWRDNRTGSYDVWGQFWAEDGGPFVVRTHPQNNATNAFLDQRIYVDFSEAMKPTTITNSNITIGLTGGGSVAATVAYISTTYQAVITPTATLAPLASYTVSLATAIQDDLGRPMTAASFKFSTGTAVMPPDSDGDGLLNIEESAYGTNPYVVDSDNDGNTDFTAICAPHNDPAPSLPLLIALDPANGSGNQPPSNNPRGRYRRAINVATETVAFTVTNSLGQLITGSPVIDSQDASIVRWSGTLPANTTLTATLSLYLTDGMVLESTGTTTFTTGSTPVLPSTYECPNYDQALAFAPTEVFESVEPSNSLGASPRSGRLRVSPWDGSTIYEVTDFVTPGGSPAVELVRTYRSNGPSIGSVFGPNWSFNYDRQFVVNGSNLTFYDEDGRPYLFTSSGAGQWSPPAGRYDQVRTTTYAGAALVQRMKDGTRYYYAQFPSGSGPYRLVRLEDHNREAIVFNRNASGVLTTITDTIGRTTTFNYTGSVLTSIVDHANRTWSYAYSAAGELNKVQTPTTLWFDTDANGNLTTGLTNPRVTDYGYSNSGGLSHALVSIGVRGISGGILATSSTPATRITYGASGEVQEVDHGSGSAFYDFDFTSHASTQIDRNGNVLQILHSGFGAISEFTLFARGLRPYDPDPSYRSTFTYDQNFELVQYVSPRGNGTTGIGGVHRWIKDAKGNLLQDIRRAHTSTQGGDPDPLIREISYEPTFNLPKRITEERGNQEGAIVTTTAEETVPTVSGTGLAAVRSFSVTSANAITRDTYTTHFFYDHETLHGTGNAVDQAHTLMGLTPGTTWNLSRPALQSYGRTTLGSFGDYDPPVGGIFVDVDGDGLIDKGGNLYIVRGPRAQQITQSNSTTWIFNGNQAIESSMTYNSFGELILSTAPDGHRVRQQWNRAAFNLTTNPGAGYLTLVEDATKYKDTDFTAADMVNGTPTLANGTDSNGLNLQTLLSFDAVGNCKTRTDPGGHTTTYTYDNMNLVTQVVGPAFFGYTYTFKYDGHKNLLEEHIPNVVPNDTNDNGIQDSSSEQTVLADFVNEYRYDSTDDLVKRDLDATGATAPSATRLVTVYQYDSKQLLRMVTEPYGNAHTTDYDERDLVLQTTAGVTDNLTSQITKYKYDENGNLQKVFLHDGTGNPNVILTYDAFDRVTTNTDQLSEYTSFYYDLASHTTETKRFGRLKAPTDPPTTLLARAYARYDEAGRQFERSREFFSPSTGAAIAHGPLQTPGNANNGTAVHTLYILDQSGNPRQIVDDNAHITTLDFDTADRMISVTDHLNSQAIRTLDGDGLTIRLQETERASDGSGSPETFYTEMFYDAEHRLNMQVEHLGNTRRWLYDSRNNVTQVSDAMAAASGITLGSLRSGVPAATSGDILNLRGNTTRFVYDGASRRLKTLRDLRTDGTGGSAIYKTITTATDFDSNSRVNDQIDDNGNITEYCYDDQNRLVMTHYANGTTRRLTWVDNTVGTTGNRVSTVKIEVDPRLCAKSYSYDAKERRTGMTVTGLPPGVGQTTTATWNYDGLDRVTLGSDDDSSVVFEYDSLGQRTAEEQTVQTYGGTRHWRTTCGYDGVGNRTSIVYPLLDTGGGTYGSPVETLTQNFDGVNRLAQILETTQSVTNQSIVSYVHKGMGGRRLSRTYFNGVGTSYAYDNNRRETTHTHKYNPTNTTLRNYAYTWDRENNRRAENETIRGLGQFYQYDSAYRLWSDNRSVPNSALNGLTQNYGGPVASPSSGNLTNYDLDGANNRRSVTDTNVLTQYFQSPQSTWSPSTTSENAPIGALLSDAALNQYTSVGSSTLTYDFDGNQISAGETGSQRFFDCSDQLVQQTYGTTDVRYRYDVLGRRLSKTIYTSGALSQEIVFVRLGWETLEEWNPNAAGGPSRTKRFVYGEHTDEPIRYTNVVGTATNYWYLDNSIGSVVGLTSDAGAVAEGYRYKAYGELDEILNSSGTVITETAIGNPFYFQGRRRDFEEAATAGGGLMYFRHRFYDSKVGRFVSRDPLDIWGDAANLGNAQTAFRNNPVNYRDPMGREVVAGLGGVGTATADGSYLAGAPAVTSEATLTTLAEGGSVPGVVVEGAGAPGLGEAILAGGAGTGEAAAGLTAVEVGVIVAVPALIVADLVLVGYTIKCTGDWLDAKDGASKQEQDAENAGKTLAQDRADRAKAHLEPAWKSNFKKIYKRNPNPLEEHYIEDHLANDPHPDEWSIIQGAIHQGPHLTDDVEGALNRISKKTGVDRGKLGRSFHKAKQQGPTPEPRAVHQIDESNGDIYAHDAESGEWIHIGNVFD